MAASVQADKPMTAQLFVDARATEGFSTDLVKRQLGGSLNTCTQGSAVGGEDCSVTAPGPTFPSSAPAIATSSISSSPVPVPVTSESSNSPSPTTTTPPIISSTLKSDSPTTTSTSDPAPTTTSVSKPSLPTTTSESERSSPTTTAESERSSPTTTAESNTLATATSGPGPFSTPTTLVTSTRSHSSSASTSLTVSQPEPITSPTNIPCNDPMWDPTPENWDNANVDQEMANWWTSTAGERGSATFVDWLAQSFGDMSRGQQCGIGLDESCFAPNCEAFRSAQGPRWVYFVRIAVVNMNILFNLMERGMQDAEGDLSLVISDMAVKFFPWKDPSTSLQKALPWIQAIVSGILGWIPYIGEELELGAGFKKWGPGLVQTAQAITSSGFQVLGQNGDSAITHELGTVQELGALIKQVVSNMRKELGQWSTTLFNGEQDATGKNIMDYMAFGRFSLSKGASLPFLDNAYFQTQVSKLVDGQWQDKKNAPSQTFVMCTNATNPPCDDISRYTEGGRTCCLYSIDGKANYVSPPALTLLGNATYNITPSDITASSLHTYLNGGLDYNDTQINSRIEQTISLNNSDTFLSQGVRFQGVWTLPVCDVGMNGNWVADSASNKMPCCCGVNCEETNTFWESVGISTNGKAQGKCKSQCPSCAISSAPSLSRPVISRTVGPWFVLLLLTYGLGFHIL